MSGPIPQLVDISHALQSSVVQRIRADVIQYSQLPQLSEDQVKRIDAYLQAINGALTQFTIDNQHIERLAEGVTDLDIQLYNGLRSMYTDYMTQLTALKLAKSPYSYQQQQMPVQLQIQIPTQQQQQQQQQTPIIQGPDIAAQAVNAVSVQSQPQFQFQPQYQPQLQAQIQPQFQQFATTVPVQSMAVQPEGYKLVQQQQQQQQQQPTLVQPLEQPQVQAETQTQVQSQIGEQPEIQTQSQAGLQVQGSADDLTAKKLLQQQRREQKQKEEERRINENIKILEYIHGELPYKKPSERRRYIDTLAENETKVPLIIKSEEFLDSMSKLCALDIDNAENIRSYIRLLKMLGYSKSKLRGALPQSLTAPSPSPSLPSSSTATGTTTAGTSSVDTGTNTTTSSTSSTAVSSGKAKTTKPKRTKTKIESKAVKSTVSKSKIKQRDIHPVEIYIADKRGKDTSRASSSSVPPSSSSGTPSSAPSGEFVPRTDGSNANPSVTDTHDASNNDINNGNSAVTETNGNTRLDSASNNGKNQGKASEPPNRKKISFSNYLKKEDSKDNVVTAKRSLDSENASTAGEPNDGAARKKIKAVTDTYITSPSGLKSILKNSSDSSSGIGTSNRKTKTIRFQNDSDLVKVYGDGLPSEGLKISPKELKKLLRPFRAGVPNEKLLLGDFIQKPRPLQIDIDVQNSDISETKGGPVPCDTKTPPYYRENFRNFNKKLTSAPSERLMDATFQDPALLQAELNRSPIIAGAFGRNRLLLRSDRGGIPYRNVPVVTRNKYPPRYSRPSRAT